MATITLIPPFADITGPKNPNLRMGRRLEYTLQNVGNGQNVLDRIQDLIWFCGNQLHKRVKPLLPAGRTGHKHLPGGSIASYT